MRALIVTNMYPSADRPALGSFVRDQVRALQRLEAADVELASFGPGSLAGYARAARDLRRRYAGQHFDVVHAHFGLTAWPALAVRADVRAVTLHGTDLAHPRTRRITAAALPFYDIVATVSEPLAAQLPHRVLRGHTAVLPCGIDLRRFRPLPRAEARTRLGLPAEEPCLLFPAAPERPEKRYERALAVAGEVSLHALGDVDPELVPLWVNAANAVLVPSEREGFGLAVLEALACEVPVLATPVGVHAQALAGVAGCLCADFDRDGWRSAVEWALREPDPRVAGRVSAERWSSDAMAARVLAEWRAALDPPGNPGSRPAH